MIAIIGVLSAVGITAYSGYTADAKAKVTTAQHKQVVAKVNAEFARCAGGSGNFAWTGTCVSDPTEALLVTYINGAGAAQMGMTNSYTTGVFATASDGAAAEGAMNITVAGTGSALTVTMTTQITNNDASDQETNSITKY